MDVAQAKRNVMSRELLLRSLTESALRRQVADGALVVAHRGCYVLKSVWHGCFSEGRHLMRVIAAHSAMRGSALVFSYTSAAVLWGLPLYRVTPKRVHVSGIGTNGRTLSGGPVAHHDVTVDESDRTEIEGVPCTTLERTVFDMIRTAPREAAVALADAALRQVAWNEKERTYDDAAAEKWRQDMWERIARAGAVRGIRQARWVMTFADGRAQLPGESVSRVWTVDLGFAVPRIQVPFPGPDGHDFEIDFEFEDVPAWGEFDGKGKYTNPEMLGEHTGWDALAAEKEREDWIRGRSQRPMARWGSKHIVTALTLGARLARFHIFPPER